MFKDLFGFAADDTGDTPFGYALGHVQRWTPVAKTLWTDVLKESTTGPSSPVAPAPPRPPRRTPPRARAPFRPETDATLGHWSPRGALQCPSLLQFGAPSGGGVLRLPRPAQG